METYFHDCACGLSELPIGQGDPILVVPLAPGLAGTHQPAFPPLKALCDGGGFACRVHATPFHDAYAAKLGHAGIFEFLDALRSGVARSATGSPMAFRLVRQDAWDALLDMPVVWDSTADEPWIASQAALVGSAEGARLLSMVPGLLDTPEWRPMLAAVDGLAYTKSRLASALLNGPLAALVDPRSAYACMYADRLALSRGSQDFFMGEHCREILALDMPRSSTRAELEAALLLCGQSAAVARAMSSLRKSWTPAEPDGPARGEWALHALWTRKVAAMADAGFDWDAADSRDLAGIDQARSLRERDLIARASEPRPKASTRPSI